MGPSAEQRIKSLETQLRYQKNQYEKQLKDRLYLNPLLRTMWQVVVVGHGIHLAKKSLLAHRFPAGVRKKMLAYCTPISGSSLTRTCRFTTRSVCSGP